MLAPVEEAKAQRGAGEEGHDGRRRPAVLLALDEREGQTGERGGDEAHAGQVECLDRGGVLALGHEAQGKQHAGHTDRKVDEEDPAPAADESRPGRVLHEDTAEGGTDGSGKTGDAAPHAHGGAALVCRKHGRDDAQGRRHHRRATHGLDHAEGDQRPDRRRQAAGK